MQVETQTPDASCASSRFTLAKALELTPLSICQFAQRLGISQAGLSALTGLEARLRSVKSEFHDFRSPSSVCAKEAP